MSTPCTIYTIDDALDDPERLAELGDQLGADAEDFDRFAAIRRVLLEHRQDDGTTTGLDFDDLEAFGPTEIVAYLRVLRLLGRSGDVDRMEAKR